MLYIYIYIHMCVYVCVCFYVCIYSFKKNLKFQKGLDSSALFPDTIILTLSPQHTGSNTLKLHKITDLYLKL